jgi:hypothetical protein
LVFTLSFKMGCVSSKASATAAEAKKGDPSKTLVSRDHKAGQVAEALPKKSGAGSDDPFITKFYNQSDLFLHISAGAGWSGEELSPPIGTTIKPKHSYDYCLFSWLHVDIRVNSPSYDLIGTASISVKDGDDGQYLSDKYGFLLFEYNDGHSEYPAEKDPWKTRRAFDITVASLLPPILTNSGWTSGMANTSSKPRSGEGFWLQDYGMDEQGRWYVSDGAICQTTKKIGPNYGGRAYPALVTNTPPNPSWSYQHKHVYGSGFTGVWQIAIKLGSEGKRDSGFCETFYLSERKYMGPGANHYMDGGAKTPPGGAGREIDIMESRWKPGPQANLAVGGGTQWGDFRSQQMAEWSDVGGLPMKDFAIFGVLIRDDNLWFYGYKPDGSQWYASDPIPKKSSYDQESQFVPYIGTWLEEGHDASDCGFSTCYKDFVYMEADDSKIAGKNPKDDPKAFGSALVST